MNVPPNDAKRKNLEILRRKLWAAEQNPSVSMADTLALSRAVDAEEAELAGKMVPGEAGWDHFKAQVILRHAASYPAVAVQWAHQTLGE